MAISSITFISGGTTTVLTSPFTLKFNTAGLNITDTGKSMIKGASGAASDSLPVISLSSPLEKLNSDYYSALPFEQAVGKLVEPPSTAKPAGGYYYNYLSTINGIPPTSSGDFFINGSECTGWMYDYMTRTRLAFSWRAPDSTHVAPSAWSSTASRWYSGATFSTSAAVYFNGVRQILSNAASGNFYVDSAGVLWKSTAATYKDIIDVAVPGSSIQKGSLLITDMCVPCQDCSYLMNLKKWTEYYRIVLNAFKDVSLYGETAYVNRHNWLKGFTGRLKLTDGCSAELDSELVSVNSSTGKYEDADFNPSASALALGAYNLFYEYATTVKMWNYAATTNRNYTEVIAAAEDSAGFVVRSKFAVADCGVGNTCTCIIEVTGSKVQTSAGDDDTVPVDYVDTPLSMMVYSGSLENKPFSSTTAAATVWHAAKTDKSAKYPSVHKTCTYSMGTSVAGTLEVQAKFMPFIAINLKRKTAINFGNWIFVGYATESGEIDNTRSITKSAVLSVCPGLAGLCLGSDSGYMYPYSSSGSHYTGYAVINKYEGVTSTWPKMPPDTVSGINRFQSGAVGGVSNVVLFVFDGNDTEINPLLNAYKTAFTNAGMTVYGQVCVRSDSSTYTTKDIYTACVGSAGTETLDYVEALTTTTLSSTGRGIEKTAYNVTPEYKVYYNTETDDATKAYKTARQAPSVSSTVNSKGADLYNVFNVSVTWTLKGSSNNTIYSKVDTYAYQTSCCRLFSKEAFSSIFG